MVMDGEFQRVNEWGWLRGFSNLARKEMQVWWRTRRWWVNALLWVGLLGLLGANILFLPAMLDLAGPEAIAEAGGETGFVVSQALGVLFDLGAQLVALGAVVLSMDLIIEEKRTGSAEWLLSKPVVRRAYILSKLVVHLTNLLLFLVILPAAAIYALICLRQGQVYPVWPFLAGVGVMGLHLFFYLALTLLLGTVFSGRAPLLAIAFGSLFAGGLIGAWFPPILSVTPWLLPKISVMLASQQAVPSAMVWGPVAFTALWSLAFAAGAVLRFEREEF